MKDKKLTLIGDTGPIEVSTSGETLLRRPQTKSKLEVKEEESALDGEWNLGAIFHNDNDNMVAEAAWNQKGNKSPIKAATQAIQNTLSVAKIIRLRQIKIYIDCERLVTEVMALY
ncbi:hypothetical protein RYX36_009980 [Vicia faba]